MGFSIGSTNSTTIGSTVWGAAETFESAQRAQVGCHFAGYCGLVVPGFSGLARRRARDPHPHALIASLKPASKRLCVTATNSPRQGETQACREPPPEVRATPQVACEPLVSRETVAKVPLTGLSSRFSRRPRQAGPAEKPIDDAYDPLGGLAHVAAAADRLIASELCRLRMTLATRPAA